MGIYRFVKRAVIGKPRQPEDPEIAQARSKGYREQALQNAENEGKQNAVKEFNKKQTRGGIGVGLGGNLNAIASSINNTEKVFGFSNGVEFGGNLDYGLGGLGGSAPKKQSMPVTEKIVRPNGTVIIRQYGGSGEARKKSSGGSRPNYRWMEDLDRDHILG